MFTTTKGYAHILCGQLHYLIMNESMFDQLCCPVSQCLLYRHMKECAVKGRFLTEIMKALKITEMTKIVFFKGFTLSMTLHLSKCARNQ